MRTTKKRIRRIVTGMICLLLMFTLTGCQIKIDIPGLGQIRLGDSKEEKEDAESKKRFLGKIRNFHFFCGIFRTSAFRLFHVLFSFPAP